MDEFIKKLIERLEELQNYACFPCEFVSEEQEEVYSFFRTQLTEILGFAKENQSSWIACSERLPELNEELFSDDMLVSFDDSNDLKIAFYDGNKKSWYLRSSAPYIGKVIAWQPLPAPYKPTAQPDSISEAWKQQTMSRFERVE